MTTINRFGDLEIGQHAGPLSNTVYDEWYHANKGLAAGIAGFMPYLNSSWYKRSKTQRRELISNNQHQISNFVSKTNHTLP